MKKQLTTIIFNNKQHTVILYSSFKYLCMQDTDQVTVQGIAKIIEQFLYLTSEHPLVLSNNRLSRCC